MKMFVADYPDVALQWHPTLNGDLLPGDVAAGSNKKRWWICEREHVWEAAPNPRTRLGVGCGVCSGHNVDRGVNDLATLRPDLAAQWHPTLNGNVTSADVMPGSNKKRWWICEQGHVWDASPNNRSRGRGCAKCGGHVVDPGVTDLATLRPDLAAEWDYVKNDRMPQEVTVSAAYKAGWVCIRCKHHWSQTVNSRNSGHGCPACANQILIIGQNDLKTMFPEVAAWWHPSRNGELSPAMVRYGSGVKYWWYGEVCGHEWESTPNELTKRFKHVSKVRCSICLRIDRGYLKIAGYNDLATTHPALAAEWHPTKNGTLTPLQVTAGQKIKAWWLGQICGHEWPAQIYSRTAGRGCPFCAASLFRSKAENEIACFLLSAGLNVLQSVRNLLPHMELDIYMPEKKIAIEYNGVYWHSEAQGKDRNYHHAKWLAARAAGVQLIQIWEDDWLTHPEVVQAMLLHKLNLTAAPRVFARQTTAEILGKIAAEAFLNVHHIQGFAAGSHYIGLRDKVGVLVAVMVLKREAADTLNIVRYATGVSVVGGFTKLLAYATREFKPDRYMTFSDHMVSDGGLYAAHGFVADKELPPDYMYVVDGIRHHKFGYRLKKFREDPDLMYREGLSERELALLNNLPRVWDAGKTRWVRQIPQQ